MAGRPVLAALVCALVAAPSAAAVTVLPGFRSPTTNIRCFVTGGPVLRCELARAAYGASLQARCIRRHGVDWHGFQLGSRTAGAITCTGGILYDPDSQRLPTRILPYGRTWRSGPFTCTSRRTGVTCRNRAGHGLFLSRECWRTW